MIIKSNIFKYLKYTLFIVVFMSMSLQNSLSTVDLFIDIDLELAEADWEEETDDDDKKEKETNDEKIEFEFSAHNPNFYTFNSIKNVLIQSPFWEFNFDIHIPPPDLV